MPNSLLAGYFDYNATTPPAPEVVEAMLPFFTEDWTNPSSAYEPAEKVREAIQNARETVAELINADPRQILFTSGGTEAINTAIHSTLRTHATKRHIVTTAVEHSATLKYCEHLNQHHYNTSVVPVDQYGRLDLDKFETAIQTPGTAIASVMLANNETGILFPVTEIAEICRKHGVPIHIDAVQAVGKIPVDTAAIDPDFLSFSSHKIYGPKGCGALYVKRRIRYQPLIVGGHQESGRRGGTENTANLVGFGRAAQLAKNLLPKTEEIQHLRDELENRILTTIPDSERNGPTHPRLPNTSNIAFKGADAESVLKLLSNKGIYASAGSAYNTGAPEPSHVLTAMGLSASRARGSIRFSLGRQTTQKAIEKLTESLLSIIRQLRG